MSDHKTCIRVECGEPFYRRLGGMYPERDHEWIGRSYCSRKCALKDASLAEGALGGRFTPYKPPAESPAVMASKALLVRCIKYGLNHDSDLGMGYEPFMARARELGLAA